jgi:hypothetical protein
VKQLLTLQELSAETGIPVATLYTMCAPTGDLPVVRPHGKATTKRKTTGRIYVKRADWDAFVESRRSAPASETHQVIDGDVVRRSISDLPGSSRYVE